METRIYQLCLLILAISLSPTALYADDTEVYFSRANAANSENQPKANVMVLLDTSGSMKWCRQELSSGNSWCSDEDERRIDMTIAAFNAMVDDLSPDINLSVGRFTGSSGGKVIYPSTAMSPGAKRAVKDVVATLDSDGGNGDPAGGTPTHEAYYEMARYMLGKSRVFGSDVNDSVCVEKGDEQRCVDVQVGWGDWEDSDVPCVESGDDCRRVDGEWALTGNNGATECNDDLPDCDARQEGSYETVDYCNDYYSSCYEEYGDWGPWGSGYCDRRQDSCDRRRNGRRWEYRERETVYKQRSYVYYQRDVQYQTRPPVTENQCHMVEVCLDEKSAYEGGSYKSPMNPNNQCERNYIVVMTDGEPNSDDDISAESNSVTNPMPGCDIGNSFDCQVDLADFLYSDLGSEEHQRIVTHQVGLYMDPYKFCDAAGEVCTDTDNDGNPITINGPEDGEEDNEIFMDDIARAGGGTAYSAADASSLAGAFTEIFDLVDENSRSISSPGVAVNQMNRFQHLNQLYYSVFEPAEVNFWEGNIKKYKLVGGEIQGSNGAAIDSSTGYFREGARSFWSDLDDGFDAKEGGARAEVSSRKLFYDDSDGSSANPGAPTMEQLDWSSIGQEGGKGKTFFGLNAGDADERLTMMTDQLKVLWGDPLHSVPVMVNYGTNDQGVQDNVVFVSNNGGMLHAIDTDDGEELFAFMPEEFIGKAIHFTLGQPALTSDNRRPLYGLDGSWVSWRRPGDTPAAAPDAVYLYGGMRRGGDDYYALDVTDTSSPTVKWKITGGMNTGDFTHLGQTWSTPTLTQVPGADGGDPVPVLIFGGGYDADNHDLMQDQGRDAGGDDVGNAVYIVNALTGNKIWSASGDDVAAMKWSVPGSVAVVDKNFDGVADNVYFGDLGGQVFRIDIDPSGENDNDVHKLADFGGTTAGDNRRFYEPPAVGYVKDGFDDVLYVAIGSGYRSHPLDEATDEAFFVFKDTTAFVGAGPTLVTVSDLTELSETVDGSVADMEDQGWYYEFSHDGEKAMSSPVIFNNTIRFSTYSPQGQDQEDNPCAVRYGSAFLHTVDMVTGAPAALNDGQLSDSRSQELEQTTPPPTPVLITDGDGSVHVVVGTEVVGDDDLGSPNLRKRRWYQMDKDQAGNFKSTQ